MDEELIGEDLDIAGDDDDEDVFGDDVEDLFSGDDEDVDALLSGDDLIGAKVNAAALAKLGLSPSVAKVIRRKMAARTAAARRKAVNKIRERRATGVYPRSLRLGGMIPVGFSASIATGDTAIITIQAPVLFKPVRLLIPGSLAPSFELVDVQLALDKLLLTSNPVPCESFTEQSLNQGWQIPTIQVGQPFTMSIRNLSGATATVRGAWLGRYAR